MNEFEQQANATPTRDDEEKVGYKQAVEKAISHLPVKNGVINIDSIWVATSLPYEILNEVLRQEDLVLPDNVDRINLKSNVRSKEQTRKSRRRRKKKNKKEG